MILKVLKLCFSKIGIIISFFLPFLSMTQVEFYKYFYSKYENIIVLGVKFVNFIV